MFVVQDENREIIVNRDDKGIPYSFFLKKNPLPMEEAEFMPVYMSVIERNVEFYFNEDKFFAKFIDCDNKGQKKMGIINYPVDSLETFFSDYRTFSRQGTIPEEQVAIHDFDDDNRQEQIYVISAVEKNEKIHNLAYSSIDAVTVAKNMFDSGNYTTVTVDQYDGDFNITHIEDYR